MDITQNEIADIMSILDANSESTLLSKLDELKKYIIDNSKKYYTVRFGFESTRNILCNEKSNKTICKERDFYNASPVTKRLYFFDSIEDIITRLLNINFLPNPGPWKIEIWVTTCAGEDKMLFKIVQ